MGWEPHGESPRCLQNVGRTAECRVVLRLVTIPPILITSDANAVANAVDRLSSSVFPQASLAQLLATLLLVGVLALAVGIPIARRRRQVRRFEQRIREREES